jgi:hypothetical protein
MKNILLLILIFAFSSKLVYSLCAISKDYSYTVIDKSCENEEEISKDDEKKHIDFFEISPLLKNNTPLSISHYTLINNALPKQFYSPAIQPPNVA